MSLHYDIETVNCRHCGSSKYVPILKAKDLITFTGESFTIVKCLDCGLSWTNPRPLQKDIGNFYPKDYAPYAITKATITYGSTKLFSPRNIFVSGYHIPLEDYAGKEVLEIGCSSGPFLAKMQEKGAKVQGIEFSDYAADLARKKNLSVHTGTLEDFKSDKKFDYIFAWMVIEHLYDPKKNLRDIKQLLKPGGMLVFSVPNMGSLDFHIFKQYWYALQPPGHLTHFDKESVKKLLESTGFQVRLMVDQLSSANYIYSLKNYLNEQDIRSLDWLLDGILSKWWGMPLRRVLDILARLLRQSGRMTIWAQT